MSSPLAGSCCLYMEDWPLPIVPDFVDVGVCVFCVHLLINQQPQSWDCQQLAADQLLRRAGSLFTFPRIWNEDDEARKRIPSLKIYKKQTKTALLASIVV